MAALHVAVLRRSVPALALLRAASGSPVAVDGSGHDGTDEFGSGEPVCSTSDSQASCPSQCVWCVEVERCAASWKTCALPAEEPSAGSTLLLLLVAALLCCGFAASRRSAGAPLAAEDGAEDSYQLTRLGIADEQSTIGPSVLAEQPEGRRLLSDACT